MNRIPVLYLKSPAAVLEAVKGVASACNYRGAVFSLLALLTLLLIACGPLSQTAEDHFQRAVELEAVGDLRGALIEWKNGLQQDPANVDARLRLGVVSLELGDLSGARAELQRAADLGADPGLVRPALGRVWLLEGNPSRVIDSLDPEDFAERDASIQAEVLILRGEAFGVMSRHDEAQQSFDAALEVAPDAGLARVGIAAVAVAQQRPGDARAVLEAALAADPALHQGWNLLGDLEWSAGNLEAAEAAYGEAVTHAPSPYQFHMKRALTRMALGDAAGLQDDARAMRHLQPRHPGTAYVEGLVNYQEGRYPEAQTLFETALSVDPDFLPAVFFLGASQFAQQRWQQAAQNLERFLRAYPESIDAARLLAAVRMQDGDLNRAEALLQRVLSRDPDDALALSLMGNLYLARGAHDQGLEHLRRLTAVQPDDAGTRVSLAAGLMQTGAREAGMRELEAAIGIAPGQHSLEVAYIIELLRDGQHDAALEAASRLVEELPDHPVPHNLRAAAFLGKGDLGSAEGALRDALRVAPGDPTVSSNLAQLVLQTGEREEAKRIYRDALRQHPGDVGLSMGLAEIEAAEGNVDAMRALLEQSIEQNPDALQPRLVLARYHLSRNEPRRALAVLEPVRQSAADDIQMLDLLARTQITAGQNEQAINTLRVLAERVPDTAEGRVRLGIGFEDAGSVPLARAQYRRALELDAAHPQALQRLAALELRDGNPETVLELARRMQRQDATAAVGYRIEGQVHDAIGRAEQAATAFAQSYDLLPTGETAAALGRTLLQLDRADEAAQILGARLAAYPDETVVRFFLAQALLAVGDNKGAIREYEDLAGTAPDNLVVLNNLAFLYQQEGDPRALEYAERAHAQAPDHPAVASTLGWVLVNRGEVGRGLPLLETARRALPDRPEVRYHYATALAKAGRPAEAREELVTLLDEVESFPQRADAEALLQTLR